METPGVPSGSAKGRKGNKGVMQGGRKGVMEAPGVPTGSAKGRKGNKGGMKG